MYNYNHMFGIGSFFMFIFWILVIVVIVWLVREGKLNGLSSDKLTRPTDILKERYAKGEINKEEFEQKKKDLES